MCIVHILLILYYLYIYMYVSLKVNIIPTYVCVCDFFQTERALVNSFDCPFYCRWPKMSGWALWLSDMAVKRNLPMWITTVRNKCYFRYFDKPLFLFPTAVLFIFSPSLSVYYLWHVLFYNQTQTKKLWSLVYLLVYKQNLSEWNVIFNAYFSIFVLGFIVNGASYYYRLIYLLVFNTIGYLGNCRINVSLN